MRAHTTWLKSLVTSILLRKRRQQTMTFDDVISKIQGVVKILSKYMYILFFHVFFGYKGAKIIETDQDLTQLQSLQHFYGP